MNFFVCEISMKKFMKGIKIMDAFLFVSLSLFAKKNCVFFLFFIFHLISYSAKCVQNVKNMAKDIAKKQHLLANEICYNYIHFPI